MLISGHPDLAATVHNMGSIERTSSEYEKALELCNQALEMRKSSLPARHPDMAASYHGIALVHEKLGRYSKARSCLEQAVEIGEHSLGHHHSLVQLYRQALKRLQKRA